MSFWSRITGRPEPERRALVEPMLGPGWGLHNAAGQPVSARLAENLSTVQACVAVTASTLASLDAYVYRQGPDGRTEAPTHPVSRLIAQPNGLQSWPDFIEWITAQVLLYGNAVAVIDWDGAGRPTALRPVPWQMVAVSLLPAGRIAYDVTDSQGKRSRYLDGEVFHLKDRSDDGMVGRSRISRAPEVIGAALGLQEFSGAMWRNAATPSGALQSDKPLNDAQFTRLRAQFDEIAVGTKNARKALILDNGLQWKPMSVSPEDAEVLASRRFTVEELCRLFQVPPPLVQDYTNNTFTNSAQASLWFAQISLSPWVRKIEAEFQRTVLGAGSAFTLSIDLSSLMRGDYATRWQSYGIAVANGILDVNEIREAEGYNPRRETAVVGAGEATA